MSTTFTPRLFHSSSNALQNVTLRRTIHRVYATIACFWWTILKRIGIHFKRMSAQPSIILESDLEPSSNLGTRHPLCSAVWCLIFIALAYRIKRWIINQNGENMDKIDDLDRMVGFEMQELTQCVSRAAAPSTERHGWRFSMWPRVTTMSPSAHMKQLNITSPRSYLRM